MDCSWPFRGKNMTKIQGEFSLIALIRIDGKAHFWNKHHMSNSLIYNSRNAPKVGNM